MKRQTLKFDELSQQMDVMCAKDINETKGGLTVDQLQSIVSAMNSNGITQLTAQDLSAQGLSFESLANTTSAFTLTIGTLQLNFNSGGQITTTVPPTLGGEDPRLNEIQWAMTHVTAALYFYANSKIALSKAESLFKDDLSSLYNGVGDAFRHAYWSALNAKWDWQLAGEYGLVHENFDGNPSEEREMDINNNNYGIALAKANPNMSAAQLATTIYNAAVSGQLTTLTP